jgi:hypothetical protein
MVGRALRRWPRSDRRTTREPIELAPGFGTDSRAPRPEPRGPDGCLRGDRAVCRALRGLLSRPGIQRLSLRRIPRRPRVILAGPRECRRAPRLIPRSRRQILTALRHHLRALRAIPTGPRGITLDRRRQLLAQRGITGKRRRVLGTLRL